MNIITFFKLPGRLYDYFFASHVIHNENELEMLYRCKRDELAGEGYRTDAEVAEHFNELLAKSSMDVERDDYRPEDVRPLIIAHLQKSRMERAFSIFELG